MIEDEGSLVDSEVYLVNPNSLIVSRENRLIRIEIDPAVLGFESWDGVRVIDVEGADFRTLLYKNQPIFHLVLIGPNGTVVFWTCDQYSDFVAQGYVNDRCLVTLLSKPGAYYSDGVLPLIVDPEVIILREDLKFPALPDQEGDELIDDLLSRINELRGSAGVG